MASTDRGPAPRKRVLLLALAAVLLHLPFIGWGAPSATAADRTLTFATDDVLPLGPLAEMHNTFVESKPDRNYAYPWWHYFVLAGAQAPYLGWLLATGGMESPSPEYPFGMADPVAGLRALTLVGRFVTVLMSAGVVVCSYLFVRILYGDRAGLLAALLTLSNPWVGYYSRTGNLDLPAVFWTAIGLVWFARILRDGLTVRRAVWLGVFAGVAMSTKDQALAVFLPLAFVLVMPRFGRGADGRYDARPALFGLLASCVAFAACTGMLVDPMRQVTHVERLFFNQRSLTASHVYWEHQELSIEGAGRLLVGFAGALADLLTWPGLVACLAGIVLALGGRRAARPRDASLVLPVAATFVLLTLATGLVVRRYLVPLAFPLDAFAALAVSAVWSARGRGVGLALAVLLLGWRGLQLADLSLAQASDTRVAAAEWFEENARPGDRVEYFGHAQKLPHLAADVETRRVLGRGAEWEGDFEHGPAVLEYLAGPDAPEFVVLIPDWTSPPGYPTSKDCPPEVFEALLEGSAGFSRVAAFEPTALAPRPFGRPVLDSPSVSPPVLVFARDEEVER